MDQSIIEVCAQIKISSYVIHYRKYDAKSFPYHPSYLLLRAKLGEQVLKHLF